MNPKLLTMLLIYIIVGTIGMTIAIIEYIKDEKERG